MSPDRATAIAPFLIANMKAEVPITTSVFAAVPADRLDYRPDGTSKTALQLLRHLTIEDEWFLNAICEGSFGPFCDESDACGIMTPDDAVARYRERIPAALERVAALPGEALVRDLNMAGAMIMPAVGFLSLAIRHSVHHRGQLTAYLRAMGSKVPAIYGPSADVSMVGA